MSMNEAAQGPQMTVLVVDDTKENLTVIGQLLRPYFHVRVANSGQRALQAADTAPQPDLILLDVMMPEMDGYQVLQTLRTRPHLQHIPVIFVTAMDGADDEERGLSLGAVDYVTKPIKPALLLARVRAHLELKKARDRLSDQNAFLDAEVHRRMAENEMIKDFSLKAMATLAEKRDNETGNHLHRTQAYIEALMGKLKTHPRFSEALATEDQRQRIAKAAPLHDIGKVGIPDAILLKPGPLTAEEFTVMKTHPAIGADAITRAMEQAASGDMREVADTNPGAFGFLRVAREIVVGHHERWDGSGYPAGLSGDAIPVAARLMALADVYDALRSARVYKAAMSHETACGIIRQGRATHFDPAVVDAFDVRHETFAEIASKFADEA